MFDDYTSLVLLALVLFWVTRKFFVSFFTAMFSIEPPWNRAWNLFFSLILLGTFLGLCGPWVRAQWGNPIVLGYARALGWEPGDLVAVSLLVVTLLAFIDGYLNTREQTIRVTRPLHA